MAISYSGPRGQSYTLTIDDNGVKKNIYLQTQMANLQPTLKQTNILNLIRNTNGVGMFSANSNTRYYYNIKEEGLLDTIMDENGMSVDPKTLSATDFSVCAKQLAPIVRAKKFSGFKKDLQLQGLENLVSVKMADYIAQVRLSDQYQMFFEAIQSASLYQQDNLNSFTTFDEGAHYVYNVAVSDGKSAYEHLCEAIDNFQRLGSKTAAQDVNKKIPHCNGIPLGDMVIIASNKFTTYVKQVPGVFAGPGGNELFIKNGIDMIEGVAYFATSQLPKDINFIIMTTGVHGAIAYEECGDIQQLMINGKSESIMNFNITMIDDPNWSGSYRIDFENTIKKDILFPELIFVSSSSSKLPTKSRSIKASVKSGEIGKDEVDAMMIGFNSKLSGLNESIATLKEKIVKYENLMKSNNKDEKIKIAYKDSKNKLKITEEQKETLVKLISTWTKKISK